MSLETKAYLDAFRSVLEPGSNKDMHRISTALDAEITITDNVETTEYNKELSSQKGDVKKSSGSKSENKAKKVLKNSKGHLYKERTMNKITKLLFCIGLI